jgi:hypothetical protein
MNIERDCLSLEPPKGCRQGIRSSILQSVPELKSSRSATNGQMSRDLDSSVNAGAIPLTSARAEGGWDFSQLWLKSPMTTFFMTSRETQGRSRFRRLVSALHPLRHILKLPKRPSHTTITTANRDNSRKMLLVTIMAGPHQQVGGPGSMRSNMRRGTAKSPISSNIALAISVWQSIYGSDRAAI